MPEDSDHGTDRNASTWDTGTRRRLLVLAGIALPLAALMGAAAVSHAQISPYPVVVTMTGPATAVSGQEITYLVEYSLTDIDTISGTDISIVIPQDTTYVSSEVVSGPAGTFVGETAGLVRWGFRGSAEETEGEVALTVRIADAFVGLIHGGCGIPGTLTFNPETRCSTKTEVFAVGTLPEGGHAGPAAGELPEAGAGATIAGCGVPVAPRCSRSPAPRWSAPAPPFAGKGGPDDVIFVVLTRVAD